MKVLWKVSKRDIHKAKAFYNAHKHDLAVLDRIERNIKKVHPDFSKVIFWKSMVSCLLTTQQKSGPDSSVSKFRNTRSFPLNYSKCKRSTNLKNLVEKTITKFGGIRRGKTIAEEVEHNFLWLENDGWRIIKGIVGELNKNHKDRTRRKSIERKAAEIISDNLKGFGPKQSRHLLQDLGLTKYEIPIDSRITKWLNDFGFPVILSAAALGDRNYYNFVLDGFQRFCEACDIYPCVMDAAIFSSFDRR